MDLTKVDRQLNIVVVSKRESSGDTPGVSLLLFRSQTKTPLSCLRRVAIGDFVAGADVTNR